MDVTICYRRIAKVEMSSAQRVSILIPSIRLYVLYLWERLDTLRVLYTYARRRPEYHSKSTPVTPSQVLVGGRNYAAVVWDTDGDGPH